MFLLSFFTYINVQEMLDCFIHPTMCFAFAWILSYTKVYQMLDWLWFIHPTMCFALVFALILSYIKVDEMFDWLWFIHPVFCLCFCFNVLNQGAGDAWLLLLYSSHDVFAFVLLWFWLTSRYRRCLIAFDLFNPAFCLLLFLLSVKTGDKSR